MLTRSLWINLVLWNFDATYLDYLFTILFTPITIILDILLSPIEIIALILHRIFEGEW